MLFQEFRRNMFTLGCFTSNQVYSLQPGFDKNNLGRWVRQGYLVKLRNGYYSFPEYLNDRDFAFFLANRIYRPSYISLHTALAFYGLIPESVIQITSVSTLKTVTFENRFGTYTYQTLQPKLMFGYDTRALPGNRTLLFATPEKALLDLLYLYPFYNSKQGMEALRLDPESLHEGLNVDLFKTYAAQAGSKALETRCMLFLKTYGL
ncbi:MAG: type IV toxin-antitoxin system AbiEi family antitoxin domain-containing protein [Bacteroidales bacterium]|nr:type IV toxin-antitoxin system AbiEi family antitoxin domain-containing protein [Bacteroidales bacterium]